MLTAKQAPSVNAIASKYKKVLTSLFRSISVATLEKIKFEDYLAEVHTPEWVDSYRAKYL